MRHGFGGGEAFAQAVLEDKSEPPLSKRPAATSIIIVDWLVRPRLITSDDQAVNTLLIRRLLCRNPEVQHPDTMATPPCDGACALRLSCARLGNHGQITTLHTQHQI